ncbi:carboxymuconolactone decarboxylase family protein [Micromonospora sp. KC213]|nr:carboxymuconolactone decarboxylase family protein [Micromonospora sp. KC213]
MRSWLLRTAVRRSLTDIRHVVPVRPAVAPAALAEVYAGIEREFGVLAPPVVLHSPDPAVLGACWAMLRETLVAAGEVDRATKEAVAAAVSAANACPYCVEVHGSAVHALAGPDEAAALLRDGTGAVRDPAARRLVEWVRADGEHPLDSSLSPAATAELVGVAVTFHYINRMVNIFLDDSPLPAAAPAPVRDVLRQLLRVRIRRTAAQAGPAGTAADRLPVAELPADLAWARGSVPVAAAFARAAAVIEDAGRRTVSPAVRELVVGRVDRWDGPTGPSRSWVHDAVAGLPTVDRPAARLALLAALASWQVDDGAVAEVRRTGVDDAELIGLTAWASLTAARRVGARLWIGASGGPTGAARPRG